MCLLDKEESGFLCEGHTLWVRAWPEAGNPPQSRGLPCGCSEQYLVEPGHPLLGEAVASGRGWPSWSLDPTGQTGLGNLSGSLLSNGTQRTGACPAAGAILIQTRGPRWLEPRASSAYLMSNTQSHSPAGQSSWGLGGGPVGTRSRGMALGSNQDTWGLH